MNAGKSCRGQSHATCDCRRRRYRATCRRSRKRRRATTRTVLQKPDKHFGARPAGLSCGTCPKASRSSTTRVASGAGTQTELCSASLSFTVEGAHSSNESTVTGGSRVRIYTPSCSCSIDSHCCPTLVRIPQRWQSLRNCTAPADKLCSKDRTDTATCSCKAQEVKNRKKAVCSSGCPGSKSPNVYCAMWSARPV